MTESEEHKDLKKKTMEIGTFEGYRVEKEIPLVRAFFVDVGWYKRPGPNPKYAFEIVVGGSVTNSLTSLKTALNMWNCKKVVLIAHGSNLRKARNLLDTTFTEIAENCSVIDSSKILRLRELTSEYRRIKNSIGYQTFST